MGTSTIISDWMWRCVKTPSGYEKYISREFEPSVKNGRGTALIHTDLISRGVIPDPFLDRNENLVQWIGESDWEYITEFTYDSHLQHADLVFGGLDTFATVVLNDTKILTSNNMFQNHRVDVTEIIRNGKNSLSILFESTYLKGKELESKANVLPCWNGDASRLYVRKAQYHYGWDWGPVLLTCGIFSPVKLDVYDASITDVGILTDVEESLDLVHIKVLVYASGEYSEIIVQVNDESGELVARTNVKGSDSIVTVPIDIESPHLWYPHKYGPQPLYSFYISLLSRDRQVISTFERKAGFRRAEVIQEQLTDQSGTSFYFKINNIPVFCAGSNWIPAHSFHTALTERDYKDWIRLAVDGNQDMLRIWGGGVYEYDIFYELCDQYGILVWQDFMFGCGLYPYCSDLAESISLEAEQQVCRLRNYCSVVLFAGNNEDYQVAEANGIKIDTPGDLTKTDFPAREYYEKILPHVTEKHYPGIYYHRGSPYGGATTKDRSIGDIHQWNVWHGTQEKYQDWAKLSGRFVSEFGMLAFPKLQTIQAMITDPDELYPQSKTMDHHDKADGFERRLALYVMENLRVTDMNLASWIYATQLMQAECLAYAYRCWRREWRGSGREYVAGALVWQLDDCWPVTSWAICDFFKRPKLAYFAIKRECAKIQIGMYRNNDDTIDIWGVNSTLKCESLQFRYQVIEVHSGKVVMSENLLVQLLPNQSTELITGYKIEPSPYVFVFAQLIDSHGFEVGRAFDWPQPLKYLKFSQSTKVTTEIVDNKTVKIRSDFPVKGVAIEADSGTVEFHDNGIDLAGPDDIFELKVVNGSLTEDTLFSVEYYMKNQEST
ncbi:glycoside hydrolase superfamily [Lipomyces oligophaga]|uniref:glycoside hydrolase superfamily n=1 Tax=Lipomyces oligophaga TaxID=45792 RepID=UPI0034CDE5AA